VKHNTHFLRQGQVMLITVLALSGTILGATTIAGLLMMYQLRQSTDAVSSAKAVYAADAGIEWRLYRFFKVDGQTCNAACDTAGDVSCPKPLFANTATVQTTCVSAVSGSKENVTIKSSGNAQRTYRAFELSLERDVP